MARTARLTGAVYLRLAPLLAGLRRLPLLGGALRWLGYRLLPAEEAVWVRVQSGAAAGVWLKLHPRFARLMWSGRVEPEVQAALAEHVKAGSVVYDVGANVGFFSLLAARLAGPEGRVYSFEPEPLNFPRLEEHIARNAAANVCAVRAAVAAENGRVRFRRGNPRSSPNLPTGQVLPRTPHPPLEGEQAPDAHVIEVPAVALDDFARTHPPPRLIKCDVEGAELDVLRGAAQMVARHHPVLLVEVHSAETAAGVTAWVAERGYRWRWLEEESDRFPRHLLAVSAVLAARESGL